MARYVKRPRPEPTDESFIALVILFGPFAYLAQWVWRLGDEGSNRNSERRPIDDA